MPIYSIIVCMCEWKFLRPKFALCGIWFFKAKVYLFLLFLIYKKYFKPWINFFLKVILFTNFKSGFIKFLKIQIILWYKFYYFRTFILLYKNKSLKICCLMIIKLHEYPCMQTLFYSTKGLKRTITTPLTLILLTKLLLCPCMQNDLSMLEG